MSRSPRYRADTRFMAALLAGACVLGAGVFALHAIQVWRTAGTLLAHAKDAERVGPPGRAARLFEQYLVIRPDDPDALARYGLILDRQARNRDDSVRVIEVLKRAVRLAPVRADLRRKLAGREVAAGHYFEAEIDVRALLAAAPDDGELEGWLGQCRLAVSGYEEAEGLFARSVSHAPGRVADALALAALRRERLDKPSLADDAMDRMVEANALDPRAHLGRARYRTRYRLEGADRDVERARSLTPDDPEVLLLASELASRRGDAGPARGDLERAISVKPGDPRAYGALAQLERRSGSPGRAEAVLRKGLAAVPGSRELGADLAETLLAVGKLDEAERVVDGLQGPGGPSPALDTLRARLLMARQDWAAAARVLEQSRPAPEWQARAQALLGECYARLDVTDLSLAAYSRATAADPGSADAQTGHALALARAGRLEEALARCRKALAAGPEAGTTFAELVLARNARLPRARRRWDEAEQAVEAAARAHPDSDGPRVLRVLLAVARAESAQTRPLLEKAVAADPKRAGLWSALAGWEGAQSGPEAASEVVRRARRETGDRVEYRLALAGAWAERGGQQAREALTRLSDDADAFAPEDRDRLDEGLAAASYRVGDLGAAKRLWGELAARRPSDLRSRLALFDLAVDSGEHDRARRLVDELRAIEGEPGSLWRYGEAARRLAGGRTGAAGAEDRTEARRLLKELGRLRPDWERVPALAARLAEAEGDQDRAAQEYRRAFELGERRPALIRRYVQILNLADRPAEADSVLRVVADEASASGPQARLAAEVALIKGSTGRALDLIRQAVETGGEGADDLVWAGRLLDAAGRRVEAESAFRRAVEKSASDPEARVALVRHLARAGRKADAEAAAEEARSRLPADREPLAMARCAQAVGKGADARQWVEAAVSGRPEDPDVRTAAAQILMEIGRPLEAEPHLRWLTATRGRVTDGAAAWARRNLARALAAVDPVRGLEDGLKLIDENLAAGGGTADDRAARAGVLATRPEHWRDAIADLKALDEARAAAPDARFLLARLLEAEGDWPGARDRLAGLAESRPDSPVFAAYLADGLLNRGDPGAAAPWVARVVKLEPDAFRSVSLRSRLLAAGGDAAASAALLTGYANSHLDQATQVASALETQGRDREAETVLRDRLARPGDPGKALTLAAFLGRRGRTVEALDLCDPAWTTCPPPEVAVTCLEILKAPDVKPEQTARVERWLEAEARKAPASEDSRLRLALLRESQGRTPEAEAIYRGVLAGNARNLMALNNNALLLARGEGRGGESLALIDRAIEAGGPRPALLDSRALVLLGLGRTGPAVRDLRWAAFSSRDPSIRLHLALASDLAGDPASASDWLLQAESLGLRALTLDTHDRSAYRRLLARRQRK